MSEHASGDAYSVGVRTETWKLIHNQGGADELYDSTADPGETRNLIDRAPAATDELLRVALDVARRRARSPEGNVGEDAVRQLRALGYID